MIEHVADDMTASDGGATANWRGSPWSADDYDRLEKAHAHGGRKAAHAAFPTRSLGSVNAALRRIAFGKASDYGPTTSADPVEIRRRFAALAPEAFADRLASLMQRYPTWKRAR